MSTNYSSQRDFLNCWSNPTSAEYHALVDSNCLGSVDTIHQMVNDVQRVLDIKENADTLPEVEQSVQILLSRYDDMRDVLSMWIARVGRGVRVFKNLEDQAYCTAYATANNTKLAKGEKATATLLDIEARIHPDYLKYQSLRASATSIHEYLLDLRSSIEKDIIIQYSVNTRGMIC